MEDHHFEQIINLKDKPSVRRNRTPEMDQTYKQQTFNHLFSIDEGATPGRKSCKKKSMVWISAATILMLASMAVLLLMVVGPFSENNSSSNEPKGEGNYKENYLDSKGKPTKGIPPKAPDPTLVTQKPPSATSTEVPDPILVTQKPPLATSTEVPDPVLVTQKPPLATSTEPPPSSEADPTTSSELFGITSATVATDEVSSTTNQLMEFTTHTSSDVCPIEHSTDTSGCLISPSALCRSPGACRTFFPNRFGKGDTPDIMKRQYLCFYMNFNNFTCHSQARNFTCSILSPSCPENPIQLSHESNYAFDVVNFPTSATNVPCSSLCTEIGHVCLSQQPPEMLGRWTELCQSMPDSSSSEICFGGTKSVVSECESSPCYNGGTCFIKGSESYCKCPHGYFGKVCNKTSLSGANITRGECVSVPEQCRSVLPYNTTRGLNLNDTSFAYIAPWDSISTVVHNDTIKRLFCALFYPQCEDNSNQVYTVCRELCNIAKSQVEFLLATLGFPSLQCSKVLSDTEAQMHGSTCI